MRNSDFESSNGITLLRVEPGNFLMGSPEAEEGHQVWEEQHQVKIESPFNLGKTPVTQRQYEIVAGQNPTSFPKAGENAAVDSVSWEDASEFCKTLSRIDRDDGILPSSWEYRLPTESEWEFACRAGSQDARYGELESIAWFHTNANGRPQSVAQLVANPWGFHDMLGNVWEWCQDWFHASDRKRSVRGGSWFNSSVACRAAHREGWMPTNRGRYVGFRLLAGPKQELEYTPAIDTFSSPPRSTIYQAIAANDFGSAARILAENKAAAESLDEIPPPIHYAIYNNTPKMLELLLEHGANIERRDQDQNSTPLVCAIVMKHKEIISTLIRHGAKTDDAAKVAERGLAGEFENYGLEREGYAEVISLLKNLGVS